MGAYDVPWAVGLAAIGKREVVVPIALAAVATEASDMVSFKRMVKCLIRRVEGWKEDCKEEEGMGLLQYICTVPHSTPLLHYKATAHLSLIKIEARRYERVICPLYR